ncbi:MAG: hypothetical protein M1812_006857 [Candelaria pacifica]|nr:MAG: hypothetical protein M1812_006857 [Candelaria pacifica]
MSIPPSKPEVEDDKPSRPSAEPQTAQSEETLIRPTTPQIKPSVKDTHGHQYPEALRQASFQDSIDTLSELSGISADTENERRPGRTSFYQPVPSQRHASLSPAPLRSWRGTLEASWSRNRGLALVILSQLFGALMNVTTRLLETDGSDGEGMHPMQILFARMGITLILASLYMWYTEVPHFPFGKREVRGLLIARGLGGFFGVYGIYYSLLYLPLAEATVITFLAPIVACWACSIVIKEPFTRTEQVAGLISLFGVFLIARPFSSVKDADNPVAGGIADSAPMMNGTSQATDSYGIRHVTQSQRLGAVGVGLIGVCGAASAYTTIRWIGKRAHPLISVNYFAVWCTIVSTASLLFVPNISFKLPGSAKEWFYLIFLGICGFAMQFLLTAGLQYEKSSRATNMVYTQMLFALAFDKLVWNTTPGTLSILGSSLILGSAIYVAVLKDSANSSKKGVPTAAVADEERGLVDGIDEGEQGDGDEERGPLRGVQEVQLRTLRV